MNNLTPEDKESINNTGRRFSSNHRGAVIVNARLKEELCTKNKITNSLKMMQVLHKERVVIDKMTPKGLTTADISF